MESYFVFFVVLSFTTALPVTNNTPSSKGIDVRIDTFFDSKPNVPVIVLNSTANVIGQGTAVLNSKTGVLQQASESLSNLVNLVPERPKGREEAFFPKPTVLAKKDSVYDFTQQFVANIFHRRPIIDTISEHEKYGNTGDQFRAFGDAIVNGYEGFSNFLNTAVDLPFNAMKQVTRKASSYFSSLGAKLVGL